MNIGQIQKILETHAASVTAKFGIYFKDLVTGQEVCLDADSAYPTASAYKVFVLAELLRQVRAGTLALDSRYPLTSEDKAIGSGVMRLMDDGLGATLKDYATLMMVLSDNTATDFLFRLVGRDNIIAHVLQPLGLDATTCDLSCTDSIAAYFDLPPKVKLTFVNGEGPNLRNAPAYTGGLEHNNVTSPRQIAQMLELFYRHQWQGPELDGLAMEIMTACQTNNRIPFSLPKGTKVAHKTGTLDRVCNDAGIVFTPKGDYILSLFYNGNTASQEEYDANFKNQVSDAFLAKVSLDVYNAYTE